MQISSTYIGTNAGTYHCYFYLLVQDYEGKEQGLSASVRVELERLARNLGSEGVVVQPFTGDVNSIFQEVLSKPWSDEQRQKLFNTPALLLLRTRFNDFDPRSDECLVLSLTSARGIEGSQIGSLFTGISSLFNPTDENTLGAVREYLANSPAAVIFDALELKPNFCGFGVDIKKLLFGLRLRSSIKRADRRKSRTTA